MLGKGSPKSGGLSSEPQPCQRSAPGVIFPGQRSEVFLPSPSLLIFYPNNTLFPCVDGHHVSSPLVEGAGVFPVFALMKVQEIKHTRGKCRGISGGWTPDLGLLSQRVNASVILTDMTELSPSERNVFPSMMTKSSYFYTAPEHISKLWGFWSHKTELLSACVICLIMTFVFLYLHGCFSSFLGTPFFFSFFLFWLCLLQGLSSLTGD